MGRVRFLACCVGLLACFAVAGCGAGSGTTAGPSTGAGPGAGEGGHSGAPSQGAPSQGSVQSHGIKGEDPQLERATKAHISATDCAALARLAERRLGTRLTRRSDPSPPLSHCRLSGPATSIDIYLDSGFAANRRYRNRIEETVQFNFENPAGLPQPVPHVGEKSAYNAAASWIPALRSLLAVRGNRWLTVTISAPGRSDRELRDEAAALARAGFKLTAVG